MFADDKSAGTPGASRRLSLRSRIVAGFLLFGLILSTGFATLAYCSMDDFEDLVVRQLMQGGMQELVDLRRADPRGPLPESRRMHARVVPLSEIKTLPASLASLQPGIHLLDEDGERETVINVRDVAGQRFFYVIALGDVAGRERFVQWLLVAIVIFGTLASGGLGLLFAGHLISPVQRLARWVDASGPDHSKGTLASQFADDEVGALATAFDRYQQRLEAFLRREREFTADASHELRSPLSVLKAGLDVMADDDGVSPSGRRALQRMDRRATELGELLDALLYLARSESEPDASVADIPVQTVWKDLIEAHSRAGAFDVAQVQLGGDPCVVATAPPKIARLVFNRLLERAIQHAGEDPVRIDVAPGQVEIRPWESPAPDDVDGGQRRSDERFGLTLLARLCQRLDWDLSSGAGDALLLSFSIRHRQSNPG